jgi:sarcosine oxidase
VDRVGRIVVGCGTSGHAFKFGPLLGELLADLAEDRRPTVDLARFSLRRSPPSSDGAAPPSR